MSRYRSGRTGEQRRTSGNRGVHPRACRPPHRHSIVATVALTENLNYIFQSDYTDYNGTNSVLNTIGVNQGRGHAVFTPGGSLYEPLKTCVLLMPWF